MGAARARHHDSFRTFVGLPPLRPPRTSSRFLCDGTLSAEHPPFGTSLPFPSLSPPFGICGSEAPPMCHRDPFPWRGVCKMGHWVPPASGRNETMGPLLLGVAHPCPLCRRFLSPLSHARRHVASVFSLCPSGTFSPSAPSPPPPFRVSSTLLPGGGASTPRFVRVVRMNRATFLFSRSLFPPSVPRTREATATKPTFFLDRIP
jgi:hypothetical protein